MQYSQKNRILWLLLIFGMLIFSPSIMHAEEVQLDYGDQPVVDSDLDGLTDLGEKEIFETDPMDIDTNGDGVEDGAEVLAVLAAENQGIDIPAKDQKETPWAWYFSRMSALIGFMLLYISIFLGASIRIPIFQKIFSPAYSLSVHRWISLQAAIFALFHGVALMFDAFIGFTISDVFIPFVSIYKPVLVGFGVVSFYLMVILVISSYLKKYIKHWIWRMLHSFNILLYGFSLIHALYLGTDLKNQPMRGIFIGLNIALACVFLINIINRIKMAIRQKRNTNAQATT